ncbi:aspartate aminotransferase family protein [Stappia taiwanensis]|uniref:Acetylornithine aminotransferase n=1 Tax=Stappia taiwanensis TaxID=992267 RepID=A0A838XU76_9HYPH|nr:aspartate aminotransferase family protein [Stappia taiwanensis]MBA4612188.1 aspartate aminotransferase family protein [Stappia taiwanensis]
MVGSSLYQTYARADLAFERGDGVWLETADGRRFLDCAGGIAVNSLGHSHPALVAALTEQAGKLWHVSNIYTIPGQQTFADKLTAATFADQVFVTNSGAEALECAIKTARRYFYAKGESERVEIITFEGAFHGRTLATIAAGGQEKYLEGFGPKAPGFVQVPFDDNAAVKAAISDRTAAVLVEPVQGEGGIRQIPTEHLRELRQICDDNGILLILDEVQTGVGRTGKLFAHEWAGITPDIMAIAKGIGGGFPIGACLATEEVGSAMVAGTHGTTYGGNPLAMAVGNAVLDVVLEEGFLEGVQRKALLFKQKLAGLVDRHPTVFEELRGAGLMLGLKCRVTNTDLLAHMRAVGVLAVGAGENVLRIMPPLIISEDEIEEAVNRIEQAATAMETETAKGAAE